MGVDGISHNSYKVDVGYLQQGSANSPIVCPSEKPFPLNDKQYSTSKLHKKQEWIYTYANEQVSASQCAQRTVTS